MQTKMKCNICEAEITHCDECGREFKRRDVVFCDNEDFEKHKCKACYVPAEEGRVE